MDRQTFERLLYEEESEALDFKRGQYAFVKATDDAKSELLKDILGFANAWRRTDAYILIGVEEVRGGRSIVVGIPESDQLADHSLQQFVSSLTHRPVRFRYEAFIYDDMHIGVIKVEQQPRPVFLKQDYGKLKKNAVYVRRGSSTSLSMPAEPDEIAQMGEIAVATVAEVTVGFVNPDSDEMLGTQIEFETEYCKMPSVRSIPNFSPQRQSVLGLTFDFASSLDPLNRPNASYFRDLAEYEFAKRLLRPVRLIINNIGQATARSVRIEIRIMGGSDSIVVDASEVPEEPSQYSSNFLNTALRGFRPALGREPGDVLIEQDDGGGRMVIECGDLQPGRQVRSEVFFVGKEAGGMIEMVGQVFADNLPQPQPLMLQIQFDVKQSILSVDELIQLPCVDDDD